MDIQDYMATKIKPHRNLSIISPFLFFRSSTYLINLFPALKSLQDIYPESLIFDIKGIVPKELNPVRI